MRLGAVISVKDEHELVGPAIAHLRAIGIDHIIACDMGSTDGTYEFLESQRSDDDFWLTRLSDQEPDHFESWSAVNVALVKSARLDWAMFLDADEFWLPATGRLRDCHDLYHADVFSVARFNVPPAPGLAPPAGGFGPGHYAELLLLTEQVPDLRARLEADAAMSWVRAAAEPKVMARPDRIAAIELGSHDVIAGDAAEMKYAKPRDLVIAHLPLTTPARFRRKLENIRNVFKVHGKFFSGGLAWHWQRWLEIEAAGGLDEEFARMMLDEATLAALRQQRLAWPVQDYFASLQ